MGETQWYSKNPITKIIRSQTSEANAFEEGSETIWKRAKKAQDIVHSHSKECCSVIPWNHNNYKG